MWHRTRVSVGLLVLVICFVLSVATPAGAQGTPEFTRLTTAPGFVPPPRTDGTFVVWTQVRTGEYFDLLAANLGDRRTFSVASGGSGSRSDPDIDQHVVVWAESSAECPSCNRDVVGKDLVTGRTFTVASTGADETRPAISGSFVVWIDDNGAQRRLMGRRIDTMSAPGALAENLSPDHRPELSGSRVVWTERTTRSNNEVWDTLRTMRLGTGSAVTVLDVYYGGVGEYDVAGDLVVVASSKVLNVIDVAANKTTLLAELGLADQPTTDGRYIFYHSFSPKPPSVAALRGYDLQTGSHFAASANAGINYSPWTRGGDVAWLRIAPGPSMGIEVHTVSIPEALATGRRPAAEPHPDVRYFSETGHNLG